MVTKIADALNISLDYLVGKTNLELDSSMLKRVEAVTKMTEKNKKHIFSLIDAFIA